jgi:HlyD family secretion protein
VAPNLDELTRKEAQAALRSPEQLDQLMVVTRARGWIMLLVMGVVIIVALAWGVFGTISKTVPGQGMLLPSLDPVVLYAQGVARVESFGVMEGEEVKVGQVLLKLRNPPLQKSLAAARETLENLRSTHERTIANENAKLEITKRELQRKQSTLQRTIKDTEKLYQLQKQQLEAESKLLDEGLIPKQQWIQSQRALAQLVEQKLNSEVQLQESLLQNQQTEMQIQLARDERALEIIKAEAQVAEYKARSRTELEIVSPIDGHVLEFRVGAFSEVAAGDGLVEILPHGGVGSRCVAYANAALAKRIKTGMRVLVSPSVAEPERYGYIVGEVREVSEVASSKAEIVRIFENEVFASELLKLYPTPLRVVVEFHLNAGTPSGFQWTSSSGLPGKISVGTICTVKVEVQRDRPIELLIPWLRKIVGIYD